MLTGLSEAEAARRLAAHGPNALPRPRIRNFAQVLLGAVREPMFFLLLAAAAIYLVLGDLAEGLFLVAGASLAVGLTVIQEARSERALAALRELAEPTATVLREGCALRIPARDIVQGDLLLVGEGERLPADARLLSGDVLRVDESVLTGESAPVEKLPSAEDGSVLLAGSMVVQGNGAAEVLRTGAETALGRIGASLAVFTDPPTALQRDARRLVQLFGGVALIVCVAVAVIYGLSRSDWVGGALAGLTVSISLIPEEFPMVLTVFMALGAWRLARHKVLVRRAAAIEALGRATLLCVDKTGTLTQNRMALARLWIAGREYEVAADRGAAPDAVPLLRVAALASAPHSVDPMDRAILDLAGASLDDVTGPHRTWPLRPERLAVFQVWANAGGEVAAAKGAPETIFRLCRLGEAEAESLRAVVERMAEEGLRVLGAAACKVAGAFPAEPELAEFEFCGLLGFIDPLRADAADALRLARVAGVSVAMITGDHPATALAIARQAGIDVGAGALTGADLAALTPGELQGRVRQVRVFARIAPEQKLQLVRAFQAEGEVVAMTGDGVNDAPALEAAEIGIAMGAHGSDVAREAADIILLDDSFSSIVGGIRLGRRIFANLRKALVFITAVHVPIAGVALLPIIFGLPPILFPMHVVLLELVIDPVCSLVFEAEPSENRSMSRPPRPQSEPLFGRVQLIAAVVQGLVVMSAVLGFYVWASLHAPEPEARGAAFACLVAANLFLAFSNAAASGVSLFDRRRIAFWSIASGAALVLAMVLYAPPVAALFQVAAPSFQLIVVAGLAAALSGGTWGVARRTWRPAKRQLTALKAIAFGQAH